MKFREIKVSECSAINGSFKVTDDGTVLLAKFSGSYRIGSLGNSDGSFMFSVLASHYYFCDPICVVLDLSDLEYGWGDTLSKTLNFFQSIGRDEFERARKMIVVIGEHNRQAIYSLHSLLTGGNRMICSSIDDALRMARDVVAEQLK